MRVRGGIDLKSRFGMSTVCLLVFLSLLFSSAFFVFSAETEDYSYPSATAVKDIYADAFLSEFVGISDLTEAEREYLKLQSGFLLSYNSQIPTSYVSVKYENDTLEVSAREYTYTAKNGIEVSWVPISATVYDRTLGLSYDGKAVFSGVSASAGDKVIFRYKTEFTVSEEAVNRLVNLSYNDAPRLEAEIKEKKAAYEREHAEYLINSEKYNEYLSALALYKTYISEKKIYDEQYADYLEYTAALEKYNSDIRAYNEYVIAKDKYYLDLAEYTKYLSYAEQNLAKIEAYEKYTANFAKVKAQLDIIKSTKTSVTSLERTVYSAIMGDTVTAVINRKGDIVEVLKADKTAVETAGVATENLRILLKDFFAISKDDTQAQYNYYITNYDAFKDNFVNLLKALDNLYLTPGVRGAMIAEEKHEKYLILVAQLYYVANALSDEPIKSYDGSYYFDSEYEIGITYSEDKRTSPETALENESFITDTDNASPLPDGYPIEPEVPEYRYMEEPTMPAPVPFPIEPTPVSEPVKPTEVFEPETVANPGNEPSEPAFPYEVYKVIEEYNDGKIQRRVDYTGADVKVRPEILVSKAFVDVEEVSVTYYSHEFDSTEKQKILYSVIIDKNSYADYLAEPPTKDEDSEFIYTHSGWTDGEGNDVNLISVAEDLKLYPKFSRIQKEYETKWVIDGREYHENPGTPPLSKEGEIYYDFSGWERFRDPVTSDVTYVAVFDTPLVLCGNSVARVSYSDGYYVAELNAVSSKIDVERLVQRAAGIGGITVKTLRGEKISLSYAETLKMADAGVSFLEISAVKKSDGYAYRIAAYGEDGEPLATDANIIFEGHCEVTDSSHLNVYYNDEEGNKIPIRHTRENFGIRFTANLGKTYYAMVEYSLVAVPLDAVNIILGKLNAGAGEVVTVSLDFLPGIRIDRIYIMDSNGVKTTVTGAYFTMPADDITVGVDYMVEQYTVTFVSDGKTIVKYFCTYGDTVTPPLAPKKASNEKYSYEFIGWSPEVSEIKGDTVFTALYSTKLLPQNTDDNMEISRGVLKLLLLFGVGSGCFVLIVIPSSVMSVILVKRHKKNQNK